MSDVIFNPGDKVVVIDDSRAVHWFKKGLIGTVVRQKDDRLFVDFDDYPDRNGLNGHIRRFRKLSPLDELL